MSSNAYELLLSQKRFDLIFKYLYVKENNNYVRQSYLESIRAFNDFYELNPSDGVAKNSAQDFVDSFDKLINNIKSNGFVAEVGKIPVGKNGEITDGAHRLAVCAALNLTIETENDTENNDLYDYKFFKNRKMAAEIMDFGALEYVKLNPYAYIVNLQSVTNPQYDNTVEEILNKYGFIYYKKDIQMTFDGYVNLKKLSYGSFWDREEWIGNVANKFAGAQAHAKASMGKFPLRAFVFVCDSLQKVVEAKAEIRALFNIGNFSVHINDTREEAIRLAETYFNKNSLLIINKRPFIFEDKDFDARLENLKQKAQEAHISADNICCAGSTPLNVLGIRKSDDLDFLCLDESFKLEDLILSHHDDQLKYYPCSKSELILNPDNHFYYNGMKFMALDCLYKMKRNRAERPKDMEDCRLIRGFLHPSFLHRLKSSICMFSVLKKIKNENKRIIVVLGVLKITYKKEGKNGR